MQKKFDEDEKMVRNGDRPFTKAKRSNCDVLDWNELQTYACLEKMLHKAIFAIQQLKKKGNTNTSSAPNQQCVKTTSKAHSTSCFKCHRISHYANKCQNQKPLVTLESDNVETEPDKEGFSELLPTFDDYAHEPMAGSSELIFPLEKDSKKDGRDKVKNRGHQANQEGPSSIQRLNQTQDLRTNLFEEGGNDVPQPMDQYMEPAQYGDQDVLNNSTEVRPSDRTRQIDHAVKIVEPDLALVVKNLKTDMDSHPADHPDSPTGVLIVTAVHLSSLDEPGQ
ncbi:hypothetical protein F2Q68_00014577 [Brassica cretica]|uniref:CCHC-type domain-containing protein n=1 Tax=Brassica cretica TaxID=69181 RepID=A0A8S9HC25_BRACR|nr:hypothetical protein F2Q68_00014577 [Brassica cretica]